MTYFIAQGEYDGMTVFLTDYIALTKGRVCDMIYTKARNEGFRGTLKQRIDDLGWKVVEVRIEEV